MSALAQSLDPVDPPAFEAAIGRYLQGIARELRDSIRAKGYDKARASIDTLPDGFQVYLSTGPAGEDNPQAFPSRFSASFFNYAIHTEPTLSEVITTARATIAGMVDTRACDNWFRLDQSAERSAA